MMYILDMQDRRQGRINITELQNVRKHVVTIQRLSIQSE